jgi:hypothetical protein
MAAHPLLRFSALLRIAALTGAAAAFLLIAPSQARAADPLTDAAELVGDVTQPVIEAAAPAVELLEPVTDPIVEATQPATDPIVEATQPMTDPIVEATQPAADPVVEATRPIVNDIVGRVEPIADPLPAGPVLAPPTPTIDALTPSRIEAAPRSPTPADPDAVISMLPVAPRNAAGAQVTPTTGSHSTTAPASTPARAWIEAVLMSLAAGAASPLSQSGDGLLFGLTAATMLGIAAGWRRLSIERLRLPSSLALAPPVPPG